MIGVVADDITGSNDIGAMFAKSNYAVDVYPYDSKETFQKGKNLDPDIMILDTDSRLDDPRVAYQKVYKATKSLKQIGVNQFFNKTCSVFRGNIGAEFDAMLDALNENFAIIVLGFPKNGRITKKSIHYVHGKPLEESEFRFDPIHPMAESNLVTILQAQTKRKVGSIHFESVKKGPAYLKKKINELKKTINYCLIDVIDQEDLYTIAQAVCEEKVLAGSSALAEELPKVIGAKTSSLSVQKVPPYDPTKGLFCAAGSLMPQTKEQIDYLFQKGISKYELDSFSIFEEKQRDELKRTLVEASVRHINDGQSVIIHSSNDQIKVRETKNEALNRGISNPEVSQIVSTLMAEITKEIIEQTGQKRFVIAGGDTSAAVCRLLGIDGMRICKEIQPGLPSCVSLSQDPMKFVLKSGSFGKTNFLEEAFHHLAEIPEKKGYTNDSY